MSDSAGSAIICLYELPVCDPLSRINTVKLSDLYPGANGGVVKERQICKVVSKGAIRNCMVIWIEKGVGIYGLTEKFSVVENEDSFMEHARQYLADSGEVRFRNKLDSRLLLRFHFFLVINNRVVDIWSAPQTNPSSAAPAYSKVAGKMQEIFLQPFM